MEPVWYQATPFIAVRDSATRTDAVVASVSKNFVLSTGLFKWWWAPYRLRVAERISCYDKLKADKDIYIYRAIS